MAIEDVITALAQADLGKLRTSAMEDIRSGKKTKRAAGVKLLRAVDGLQRAEVAPADLVVRKVPVIPAGFRPYSVTGQTFIPGDANELYSDLFKATKIYRENLAELGPEGAAGTAAYLRSAVAASYGYGESPNPKIRARRVSGFLSKILGSNPKQSWVQSKLLAKPQDFVGRGVISPDPDLGMDEIGIPADMAWTLYDPHIQKRLVSQGVASSRARLLMKERHPLALSALEAAMKELPVLSSRAPAWHKFNAVSAYPRIMAGNNIRISPFITAGQNADFDGDTMALHVPALPEAVKDAREKLLPSRMLFSIRDRNETLPQPKHEMLLGLFVSQKVPSGRVHRFADRAGALAELKAGRIKLDDEIEIGPPKPLPPIPTPHEQPSPHPSGQSHLPPVSGLQ